MTGKKPKRPKDSNQLAKLILDIASGHHEDNNSHESESQKFGRAGGKRGGVARAKILSPERRSEVAKAAAAARWGNNDDGSQ